MSSQQFGYISKSQLDTIRAKVATDQQDNQAEERRRLKQLSDERAAQWPNTLQAARARKERARVERLAAEEAERIEADQAEAEMRAEQRRIQIERANKILFDTTDKVKALHGKMLLCDAIKENESLIGFKKQIAVLNKAQEAAFVEQQRQALEIAEAAELARYEAMKQKALEQKAVQTQQLEDMKTRILAERAENKREGELLRQRAQQEAEELAAKQAARLASGRRLNAETMAANEALKTFKQHEKSREVQQEAAIEAYSRKKAELQAEREAKEAQRRAAKEAERKAVADTMAKAFTDASIKEEVRLKRDIEAAEHKAAREEAARRQRIKDQQAAIDRSNQLQLQIKAEAKASERADEQAFAASWSHRVKELKAEEEAERRAALEAAKKLQGYQLHQTALREKRKGAQKHEELQDAAQIQAALQEQDQIFHEYADEVMKEYKAQGKTIVPIQLHLTKKDTLKVLI
ncbi:uncharacterized protein HaLaN_23823 [Haematococcus lacustris]|uniref:Trichohyalin-plectin-homology domain-containing protein n=1 Tax=Haematococcus lacustris TaxID=44745 RepID=A0A699ZSL6_HAELA|nr:uncharacterized protein HaLaN_23823 [Haematococcus lacustris]